MTPERDTTTKKTVVVALAAATYAADQAGGLIDMLGFHGACLNINVGVGGITFTGTNKIEFVLQVGNASDGSDLANITDADLVKDALCPTTVTNGIVRSLVAAHAAADVQKLGIIGGWRYAKLTSDFSGTHGTGTPLSATLTLERGQLEGAA